MDINYCMNELERNARAIEVLVSGIESPQARWKPNPDSWSILEVINHLYDEERDDFRTRVRHVLTGALGDPPPIDPVGWVTARDYNTRDLAESVSNFRAERANSLAWLTGLNDPDWESTYTASWGSIRAGDLMVAWTAHDLLHVRQINELKWAYGATEFEPYTARYAGDW